MRGQKDLLNQAHCIRQSRCEHFRAHLIVKSDFALLFDVRVDADAAADSSGVHIDLIGKRRVGMIVRIHISQHCL